MTNDEPKLLADSREALANVPVGGTKAGYFFADALLASGVVSLAADRDRATAERAWEGGFHAAGLLFGLAPQRDLARRNPYRESEEQA